MDFLIYNVSRNGIPPQASIEAVLTKVRVYAVSQYKKVARHIVSLNGRLLLSPWGATFIFYTPKGNEFILFPFFVILFPQIVEILWNFGFCDFLKSSKSGS